VQKMTAMKPTLSPLKYLLENAARDGDVAAVSPRDAQAARLIATENNLNVEIYVIPETKKSLSPQ
jgi:hypothetical protein